LIEVPLSSICEINPRISIGIKDDDQCSFIPMGYIDAFSGAIAKSDSRNVDDVRKGYTFFQEHDVLFAKITPCMENGKCTIAKNLINGIGFGSTESCSARGRKSYPAVDFLFSSSRNHPKTSDSMVSRNRWPATRPKRVSRATSNSPPISHRANAHRLHLGESRPPAPPAPLCPQTERFLPPIGFSGDVWDITGR